jgi:hypothetical protein
MLKPKVNINIGVMNEFSAYWEESTVKVYAADDM